MKKSTRVTIALLAIVGLSLPWIAGCIPLSTAPPTKVERALFDTVTNVVTITNMVPVRVTMFETNPVTVFHTNELEQVTTTISNIVNAVWVTNTVPLTHTETNYVNTTKPEVKAEVGTIGGLVNWLFPGAGSAASGGAIALLGLWATIRSGRKGQDTGGVLVNELETAREFLRALPNGNTYDDAFVKFLQAHQAEEGQATQVASLLESQLSNPDAKAAAQGVIDTLNALKITATPIPPIVVTAQ